MFWHIQAYSGIFRTLFKPDIFRTPAYSEHWHIQHPGIFRTLACLELEAYSEPCQNVSVFARQSQNPILECAVFKLFPFTQNIEKLNHIKM